MNLFPGTFKKICNIFYHELLDYKVQWIEHLILGTEGMSSSPRAGLDRHGFQDISPGCSFMQILSSKFWFGDCMLESFSMSPEDASPEVFSSLWFSELM